VGWDAGPANPIFFPSLSPTQAHSVAAIAHAARTTKTNKQTKKEQTIKTWVGRGRTWPGVTRTKREKKCKESTERRNQRRE
jgi:hypothetical protein